MAYSKQTWTNDVTAITAERMTHIENGIYDNSLATDKINPSGTATTTAEIEEGQVTDVIGFKSLKLKGQTSQETTQGNNLLNIYARHPAGYTETVSGVTFTYNNDGSVNAKGTATADINFFLASNGQLGDDIFNGTNYLSGCTGGSSTTFHLQFWADTIGHFQNTTTEVATNKTAGVNWNITIGIKNGVTIDKTFYPMMSATSGKTFEKYTGGKASPNPDFPQDVNNVGGDNVIKISNKNLWGDLSFTKISGGLTFVLNKDGSITISGTSTSVNVTSTLVSEATANNIFVTLSAGTYTVSGGGSNYQIQIYSTSGTLLASTNVGQTSKTFTLSEETDLFCRILVPNSNTTLNKTIYVQLEKGSSATSYIAHQGNNFEINLGKNLFNKDDSSLVFNGFANRSSLKLESNASAKTICQPCKPNTTYTISKTLSARFFVDETSSSTISSGISITPLSTGSSSNVTSHTVTTSASAKYLLIYYYVSSADTLSEEEIRNSIQIEKGANTTNYASFFPPIEICKIGTYQDYIFKKDGKWWKHKEVEKITLNGSETPTINTALTNTTRALYSNILPYNSKGGAGSCICNLLPYYENWVTDVEGFYLDNNTTNLVFRINKSTVGTTITSLNNFLSENNMTVYYILETAIEEEITYAPLIRQLDELYNSGLYDVTNISQDNSSEAFVLDLEACKNNINGIVEYIRR